MSAAANFRFNAKAVIERRELSQRAIAARMDGSYSFLCQVLNGKSVPTLDFVDRFAVAVGIPADDLVGHPEKFAAAHLTPVSV